MKEVHAGRSDRRVAMTDLLAVSRYTAAGAIGTTAHFGVLFALVRFIPPVAASTLGAVTGCLINYSLAKTVVFRSEQPHFRAFPRFLSVATIGVVVNAVVFGSLVSYLPLAASQLVASAVVLLIGFALNRRWTFHGR